MRINGFEQIKGFYSWVFGNQDKGIKPQHISLYLFFINQNNRNNWVEWFKCPFDLAMAGSCISSKKTYYSCLTDLQNWGLIKYTAGVNNWKSPMIKIEVLKDTSTVPQCEPQPIPQPIQAGIPQPIPNIKQVTYNHKQITINEAFDIFWNLYGKKEDTAKCKAKFLKLEQSEIEKIFETLPAYIKKHSDIKYRKNPMTYLNGKCWLDDITITNADIRLFEVSGKTGDGGSFKQIVSSQRLEEMQNSKWFKIEKIA